MQHARRVRCTRMQLAQHALHEFLQHILYAPVLPCVFISLNTLTLYTIVPPVSAGLALVLPVHHSSVAALKRYTYLPASLLALYAARIGSL